MLHFTADVDTTQRIELSVVVVNYNTRQLTLDCLSSIYRSGTGLTLEVIVIDNASTDGSAEAICAAFPQVVFVANATNRYFSAAYTQGIHMARGQYVLVLNPDMVVQGQTLSQLLDQFKADPALGAATTVMYFPDGRLQRNGSRFTPLGYLALNYTFLGKVFARHLRKSSEWLWYADWDRRTTRDIDVLPGSCIIAAKATWLAAGAFDARMKMYFSDDYFSRRVQQLSKRTVYLLSDGIIHYEGASAKQMSAWALRTYLRDLLIYTQLVFGRPAQALLAVLLIPTYIAQRIRAR
jgi:GT2 family glycosyltransferase